MIARVCFYLLVISKPEWLQTFEIRMEFARVLSSVPWRLLCLGYQCLVGLLALVEVSLAFVVVPATTDEEDAGSRGQVVVSSGTRVLRCSRRDRA